MEYSNHFTKWLISPNNSFVWLQRIFSWYKIDKHMNTCTYHLLEERSESYVIISENEVYGRHCSLFDLIILPSLFSTCRLIGTGRGLLTGHDALLLWHIARDILYALSHRHDNTRTACGEPVVSTGGGKCDFCAKIPFLNTQRGNTFLDWKVRFG